MEWGPLFLSPGRLLAAAPWLAISQTVDIPPIDFSNGTWWIQLLIWFLTVYGGARALQKRTGPNPR